MTTVADKLYTIYEQNGIISSTNSDGFNSYDIKTMDEIFQESFDLIETDNLLSEGFFENTKSLIGNIKDKTGIKKFIESLKIKNETDLKKMKTLVEKYGSNIPPENKVKEKLFKLNDSLNVADDSELNSLYTRIKGWISTFYLMAIPLSWIMLLIVLLEAKASGKKISEVWNKIKSEIEKGINKKNARGLIPKAIQTTNKILWLLLGSIMLLIAGSIVGATFHFSAPFGITLAITIYAIITFWDGIFEEYDKVKPTNQNK